MAVKRQNFKHSKKIERATTREFNTPLFMLRCVGLGLSVNELDNYEMGMIYDMLTEQANDSYDYPLKPRQEDFDKFKK